MEFVYSIENRLLNNRMLIEKTDHRISFYLTTEWKEKVRTNATKYKVKPTDVYRTAIILLLELNPEIGEIATKNNQSLAEFINTIFEVWKLDVQEWEVENDRRKKKSKKNSS